MERTPNILPKSVEDVSGYRISDEYFLRLCVRNQSRFKVVRNAKPFLKLKGHGTAEDVSYEIIVDGGLCWAELGNPSRIDINCGEGTPFDFCLIIKPLNVKSAHILFPSEKGYKVPRPIMIKEIRNGTVRHRPDGRIEVFLFLKLNWNGEIVLTSDRLLKNLGLVLSIS